MVRSGRANETCRSRLHGYLKTSIVYAIWIFIQQNQKVPGGRSIYGSQFSVFLKLVPVPCVVIQPMINDRLVFNTTPPCVRSNGCIHRISAHARKFLAIRRVSCLTFVSRTFGNVRSVVENAIGGLAAEQTSLAVNEKQTQTHQTHEKKEQQSAGRSQPQIV